MKKLIIALALMIATAIGVSARDTYSRDVNVLPAAAKTAIANNFKAKVNIVKIDKDLGRISEYEVTLTDGTEITFDRDGNWKDVEVGSKGSVPAGFVLKEIRDFVKSRQSGAKIIGIEKNRSGYEVELSNGVEMKFDRAGVFQRYD